MKNVVIGNVCLYAASSSVLLVLNKISITAIPNTTLLLSVQLLSTTMFILVPGLLGVIQINTFPPLKTVKAYFSVAAVFLTTIYSNFQVINAIGVNSFIVLRCGTPLVITYLDWIFLGREFPRGASLLPLLGIFVCASTYSFLKLSEQPNTEAPLQSRSTLVAVLWSLVWFSSFILDMVYIKYVVHAYPCSGLERTLYQNVLALPMLLLSGIFEPSGTFSSILSADAKGLTAVILSCIAGTALSYTGMSLRSDLSATSFTVLGITCKMASAILSEIFVAAEKNKITLLCLVGVIISSAFYRQAPKRTTERTPLITLGDFSTLGQTCFVHDRKSARRKGFLLTFAFLLFCISKQSIYFSGKGDASFRLNENVAENNHGIRVESSYDLGTRVTARPFNFGEKSLWGVTTTILEVNPAVIHFVETFDANLVVVGDKKTNHSLWHQFESQHGNVIYLAPEDQQLLGYAILKHIPWNHFGRKSIGFIFALRNGAEIIYDFDDDNHLLISDLSELQTLKQTTINADHHVFNPYPFFEPKHKGKDTFVWPRGFPLGFIQDPSTFDSTHVELRETVSQENLAVVQSLANHDPDVDAIYRLSRPLPVYFGKSGTLLVPPRGIFIPWNAQAVLLKRTAFFGLLLPVSVTGRVSDIWRSYLTSRLLWETEYRIGFSSPFVNQYRNPHSYMKDLEEEKDLYYKVDGLLTALLKWTSAESSSLEEAYLGLITEVVSSGFLGVEDLDLARAWCGDLRAAKYEWPKITSRMSSSEPKNIEVIDERDFKPKSARNAVCLVGKHHPDVEAALETHVLQQMEADLFIVTDTASTWPRALKARNVTRLSDKQPDLESFFNRASPNWKNASATGNFLGGLPGRDVGHGAYQLRDRWFCEQAIQNHEMAQGHGYENVGVGRADLLWLLPHPEVSSTGCWIPCEGNDWGGVCDHWAWCDRRSASKYLTGPLHSLPLQGEEMNTEQHLKFSLAKENVKLARGKAAFIRLCTKLKSCVPVFNITSDQIHAKISGEQIEAVKDQVFENMILHSTQNFAGYGEREKDMLL